MSKSKIVVVGAGSASFGPTVLAPIMRHGELRGSELALVDLNEESLGIVEKVAQQMNGAWDAQMNITATSERREVLESADFVVISIEVPPREKLWRLDWEIPLRHGLRQPYGENGGPGGLMHACRQIPPFMEIVRDMEAFCPDAWLINFSNPLPRITRAITKYTQVKTVGKCHQIAVGYGIAAVLLRERYGVTIPEDISLRSDPDNIPTIQAMAAAGRSLFDITSAGLNHFIWLLEIRDKKTGEDLYPALRAALDRVPPTLEPFSMELFRIFGYCPIAGDTHVVEYLPWAHDPVAKPWLAYDIPLYDWEGNESARDYLLEMMNRMATGAMSVAGMRDLHSEGAAELIVAMRGKEEVYDETVNVPNCGAIANLPEDTIVEVPAMVNNQGIRAIPVGAFPEPIAELMRREAALVEMVVDTAVTGDRERALQALLLDPMINDIGRARAILEDYLSAFAEFLPQF